MREPVLSEAKFTSHLNEWGRRKVPFVFISDFLGQQHEAWRLDEADPTEVLFDLNGFTNDLPEPTAIPDFYFHKYPLSFEKYLPKFDYVVRQIRAGNSFLTNLSAPTPVATDLSLHAIFRHSQARYRLWRKDRFVCFSPEIFVKIQGTRIASYPMKGTLDAARPNAEQVLLSDPKEAAEHATIVDLIRNDLSMVARRVVVERYRYLDRLLTNDKTLLQVSSEITGQLPPDFDGAYGDLLRKLLPAGSISGAPKPSTLRIIREAEGYERGYYTGVMGYFDGSTFESAVMIRYIENQEGKLVFKSGGGITARSQAQLEYQELIDKVYLPFTHEPTLHRDHLPAQPPAAAPSLP
ncbi:aminodeoxychorismate synthase component I [Rhabdobacter roseus]|uniref:Para-aminobenzoate synthetase component 1 n=1 Tax=Rhabdobacter roseus TaxID=1655419 RepID=A0A840TUL3_9BACT|nr:aminodeoxychorismate synthase component I [Rhabdobacter roseus]MBB5284953.1 para-aminobenzoate synthetase component 1 [Rhabdobacter roseus]